MNPVKGVGLRRVGDRRETVASCTDADRGKSKRNSKWLVRFNIDSWDDTEQAHAIVCSELFEPEPIRQDLGIAVLAGRERMGQLLPAQQEADAEQVLGLESAASGQMPCAPQNTNAIIKSRALRGRDIGTIVARWKGY